jgi:hypothetical protein
MTMPLRSLSHPPLHVDGSQPLTSASIQVTSFGCPGPGEEMTGRLVGRNSPPQPAHKDKWYASEMSMEKWKSQRFIVLLS